jgi:hypothetical protein
MDGTFKIAPNLFKQIYVILAKKFGDVHLISTHFFLINVEKLTTNYFA